MVRIKQRRVSKVFWISSVFIASLVFFAAYTFTQQLEDKKNKETFQIAKQEVELLLSKMVIENRKYDDYVKAYTEEWEAKDLNGVYKEASRAYEQAKMLQNFYMSYKVPVEVPEHVLTLFEGLESDLSVAFGERAEAFELVLAYLGSQDPTDLEQAEAKLTEANDYYLSGSENIELIREQMKRWNIQN
jgi:hypothetical protein